MWLVSGRSCLFFALYALPSRKDSSVVPSTDFVAYADIVRR